MMGLHNSSIKLQRVAQSAAAMCLLLVSSVAATGHSSPPTVLRAVKPGGNTSAAGLVGSWRLRSRESRRADGTLEPDPGLSTTPAGVLVYDSTRHVAVQLSRRNRTVETMAEECRAAATIKGKPDTAQTVLGYDAYFGTYAVNEKEGTVTHHLEAAIFPGDVGKDILRHYVLKGDLLTLSFDTTTSDGVKVTRTLVWERMT